MDKVLLVFPKTGLDQNCQLPLGLLSLASTLVEDYEVKIIDQRLESNWAKKVEYESKDSIAVAITSMTGKQIQHGLNISKISTNSKIIWGGVHPTLLPKQTLENKYIDFIVMGEGENTLPRLLKALKNNGKFESIEGIGYKDAGGIHINEKLKNHIDLNKLPDIPYFLIDIDKYITKRDGFERCLTLETSRGCPHNCSFCANPIIHERKWRCLNVENIIRKIKYFENNFNLDGVIFQEDNFFVNSRRVKKFCEKKDVGIGWKANCRIEYLINKDKSFFKMLENAGCKFLQFGVESGSNRILNLLNKGFTIEDILKINRQLDKTNIKCRYNFIIGIPTETIEEIQKTLYFIDKLKNENGNLEIPFLNIYTPWPGTQLYNLAINKKFNPPDNLEGWVKYNWNSCNLPWLNRNISRFLEEISTKYRDENEYFAL